MARVNIPMVGQEYSHTSKPLSSQVAQNWYPEANPGTRNSYSMRPTPGLKEFSILEGVDRGMHRFNEELFTVNGSSLYEVAADGTYVNHGTIEGDARCIMADDGNSLIITTTQNPYIYTVNEGLQLIDDPDLVNPTSVAYLNGQFIFDQNDGTANGVFVTSELLTTEFNINALDFATAESHPDDITRILTVQNTVWMMGARSVEQWYNSGVGRPPFDRMPNGTLDYGLMGREAACYTGRAVYWLDEKRQVLRSTGGAPQVVSNPSLGAEFGSYGKLDDCIAMWWTQESQVFVAFTFPTENKTWLYHEPTGQWSQWAYGTNGDRARPSSIMNAEGVNFAADHTTGQIYQLDPCTATDGGEVIQRRRITPVIHGGLYGKPGQKMYFDTVEFLFSVDPCVTRIAERIEPEITTTISGVCGDTSQVDRGLLLSPVQGRCSRGGNIAVGQLDTLGKPLQNTKAVSFTVGFNLETEPPFYVGSDDEAYLLNAQKGAPNAGSYFGVYIDTSGHIKVIGRNSDGNVILDCTITNGGGSFCDNTTRLIAFACDLGGGREVWIDGEDITESGNVTWNTYENEEIFLGDGEDLTTFGICRGSSDIIGGFFKFNGAPLFFEDGRSVAFLTFDDSCSLIPRAVWDINSNVVDPQGDFTGWYTRQPFSAFAGGWWVNGGRVGNDFRSGLGQNSSAMITGGGSSGYDIEAWPSTADIAYGVGNDQYLAPNLPVLPPPSPEAEVQIVAPYYNQTGNYFVLSDFTTDTFSNVFGVEVGGAEVTEVIDTPAAIWFNTNDAGNTAQILSDGNYSNTAKMWITDTDGVVQSSSNSQVSLATGGPRYLVVASDTGKANIRKFGQQAPVESPNDPARQAAFAAFFGESQEFTGFQRINWLEGSLLRFNQPLTSVPMYHKAGRITLIQVIITTSSFGAFCRYAFAKRPGVVSGSDVIDTDGGNGSEIVIDESTPPGWYWINFQILDFQPGVGFLGSYNGTDQP